MRNDLKFMEKGETVTKKILIIIPARNESKSIQAVISNIQENCPQADYVVINDESFDNTLEILTQNKIPYLNPPINLGIGGAVQLGYQYALKNDYDIAIQIDGDGQHDAAYIKRLIEPIERGKADIVIGSRYIKKEGFQSSRLRRLGIKWISLLIWLCCGYHSTDPTSGFRAVNKNWIAIYAKNYPADYPEPEALLYARLKKASIEEVPVVMKARQEGVSSINLVKSIYYMMKVSFAIIILRCGGGV